MLIDAHTHILSLAEDAVIAPAESVRDHPGFDKVVILAVSPQFLDGELIGTVDSYGITGVPRAKLLSVNSHAERVGAEPVPQAKLDGILGDNYARMLGLLS
jgi:hypothetical protein